MKEGIKYKKLAIRLTEAELKKLKLLSVEHNTSMQTLVCAEVKKLLASNP